MAADPVQAHLLKDHLAEHRIEVDVFDAHAIGARGELAAIVYPRLVLRDPAQHDRARAVIASWEARGEQPDWACLGCGEANPAAFESCWACGLEHV
nr:DUF2007 domain-containing protein [Polycyclovorans algicola]